MKTPTKQRHMSLSSQTVSNNENVCAVAYIVPDLLIASFGKESILNRLLVPGLLGRPQTVADKICVIPGGLRTPAWIG